MEWPLFSTFTTTNHADTGRDFIRQLHLAFRKIRRLRWWIRAVTGGIASIEVTNTGKGWHPHLHAVMDARWLAVTQLPPARGASGEAKKKAFTRANKEVCEQWSLAMGRPSSVKTKRAWAGSGSEEKSVAMEVIKYSVKGSDLVSVNEPIAPILRMLDGTRLLTSWGTCYGHLREYDTPKIPTACKGCGLTGTWATRGMVEAMMRPNRKRR
jgi:hypothetical protein